MNFIRLTLTLTFVCISSVALGQTSSSVLEQLPVPAYGPESALIRKVRIQMEKGNFHVATELLWNTKLAWDDEPIQTSTAEKDRWYTRTELLNLYISALPKEEVAYTISEGAAQKLLDEDRYSELLWRKYYFTSAGLKAFHLQTLRLFDRGQFAEAAYRIDFVRATGRLDELNSAALARANMIYKASGDDKSAQEMLALLDDGQKTVPPGWTHPHATAQSIYLANLRERRPEWMFTWTNYKLGKADMEALNGGAYISLHDNINSSSHFIFNSDGQLIFENTDRLRKVYLGDEQLLLYKSITEPNLTLVDLRSRQVRRLNPKDFGYQDHEGRDLVYLQPESDLHGGFYLKDDYHLFHFNRDGDLIEKVAIVKRNVLVRPLFSGGLILECGDEVFCWYDHHSPREEVRRFSGQDEKQNISIFTNEYDEVVVETRNPFGDDQETRIEWFKQDGSLRSEHLVQTGTVRYESKTIGSWPVSAASADTNERLFFDVNGNAAFRIDADDLPPMYESMLVNGKLIVGNNEMCSARIFSDDTFTDILLKPDHPENSCTVSKISRTGENTVVLDSPQLGVVWLNVEFEPFITAQAPPLPDNGSRYLRSSTGFTAELNFENQLLVWRNRLGQVAEKLDLRQFKAAHPEGGISHSFIFNDRQLILKIGDQVLRLELPEALLPQTRAPAIAAKPEAIQGS